METTKMFFRKQTKVSEAIPQMHAIQLENMIDMYNAELYRMCCLYLKDPALAQDAMQETWMAVYQKWDTFRGDSNVKTWLIRITINKCKTMLRSNWRKKVTIGLDGSEQYESASKNTENTLEAAELKATILQAVSNLPKKYKEIVILYFYNDLTIAQIAAVLNIPTSTVGSRLSRAKKKLKHYFREENEYER